MPRPCTMPMTMGMATAAVAVLLVTSESRTVNTVMTSTVTYPPVMLVPAMNSPMAAAAPLLLIRVPAARPPANT